MRHLVVSLLLLTAIIAGWSRLRPAADVSPNPVREAGSSVSGREGPWKSAEPLEARPRERAGSGRGKPSQHSRSTRSGDRPLSAGFYLFAQQAERGDTEAMQLLFHELGRCRSAPRSGSGMLEDAQRIRRRAEAEGKDAEHSLSQMQKAARRCAGITDAMLATHSRWGSMLAERGDTLARLQFQEFAKPDPLDPEYAERLTDVSQRARSYLDDLLEQGEPAALFAYQQLLGSNRLMPRDAFGAYMHGFAFTQVASPPPGHAAWHGLQSAAARLTPEQVQLAERQGMALLNRCCRR